MMRPKKLAVVATHPIQYQTPWFQAMAQHSEIDLQVFFCHDATAKEQAGAGFGVAFQWDIPLLQGYPYRFLKNVAKQPSIATFSGLDTPEIAEIVAHQRFDAVLVLGWNFKSAWQTFWACRRSKTPVMVRGDSHLHTPRHPLKNALKDVVYRRFIPRFDACLAVGRWSREYYEHYGARAERIFFVPHVLNEAFFLIESQRLRENRSALSQKWGLKEDALVVAFVGKFIEVKRPMDFVLAVALAARSAPVEGLMVGDGALRAECERLAREQGVPVRFAGFLNQSEIVSAYAVADVLALCSQGETWGMVVNEAMLCGLPCVVNEYVGCGPDLIVPEETGAIYPVGDVAALGRSFIRFANNRAAIERMGETARRKVQEEYSVSVAVAGVLQALAAVGAR